MNTVETGLLSQGHRKALQRAHDTGRVSLANPADHARRPIHTIIAGAIAREAERQDLVLSKLDDYRRMPFAVVAARMIADHAREENTRRIKRDTGTRSILPILDASLVNSALMRHYENLIGAPVPDGRRAVYELQQSYVALARQNYEAYPEILVAIAVGNELSEAGYSEASDVIENDLLAVYGATLYMQGKRPAVGAAS